METFWSLLSNTYIYLFYVYFHHTGCPKKWTVPWNGLKIEIYDFNNYSCYPKKCFPLRGGASCPEYIHTLIQSVFSPYRVSENAIKWAKNWCIWLQSVHFLGHPVWWKFTLNKYIFVFGTKGSQKAQPHKLFWESSYSDWSHIFQFSVYFMALSIFRTPCMVKIHLE